MFPQHAIADLISGITFIEAFTVKGKTHTHTHTHTHHYKFTSLHSLVTNHQSFEADLKVNVN